MKKKQEGFKKGAASFYIVAFSTLILVIIAVSFASVIISAISRTSNDELAQSAYDSALAGVEDAKLAYTNYIKCKEANPSSSGNKTGTPCERIIYWLEQERGCDMVGKILGKITNDNDEVAIRETASSDNKMEQAYTCVKINTDLSDILGNVSSTNQAKVVQVNFKNDSVAKSLEKVRVSWYRKEDDMDLNFKNFSDQRVYFSPNSSDSVPTPPTLMVGLVQTNEYFSFGEFDRSSEGQTNRATVYLVPTDNSGKASSTNNDYYNGAYKGNENSISKEEMAKTNDHGVVNKPFAIYCNSDTTDQFVCSVDIYLPEPIGGNRSNETFAMLVSIPYGKPNTDFSLKFFCKEGANVPCNDNGDSLSGEDKNVATLVKTQIEVDSTGRANNLYRRVLTRLESPKNNSVAVPFYAIQLFGEDGDVLKKDLSVQSEWNPD